MDYRGVYEDLLPMEARATAEALSCGIDDWLKFNAFAESCRQFRLDLLMRYYSPLGEIYV